MRKSQVLSTSELISIENEEYQKKQVKKVKRFAFPFVGRHRHTNVFKQSQIYDRK